MSAEIGDLAFTVKLAYTVEEVCALLQISRTTLWRLVRAKKLKPVNLYGIRKIIFAHDELIRFVNGGRNA